MLFVATSINYMDRQVLSILKPMLQHSIGMTELDYGHIVALFTGAYALGLLAAGRFIDKVSTPISYKPHPKAASTSLGVLATLPAKKSKTWASAMSISTPRSVVTIPIPWLTATITFMAKEYSS
jgi:MFS family permease